MPVPLGQKDSRVRKLTATLTAALSASVLVITPLVITNAAHADGREELHGTLVEVAADQIPTADVTELVEHSDESSYFIRTDDGLLHPIDPADHIEQFTAASSGAQVALSVETTPDGEPAPVIDATITDVAPAAAKATRLYVVAVDDPSATGSVSTTTARSTAQNALDYWTREGRGALTNASIAQVVPWTVRGSCATPYSLLWNAAASGLFPAGMFFEGTGNHLAVIVPASCQANYSYSGMGTIGAGFGDGGLIYVIGSDPGLFIHELGHNFGLGHSNIEVTSAKGTTGLLEYYGIFGPQALVVLGYPMSALDVAYQQRLGVPNTNVPTVAANTAATLSLSPVNASTGNRGAVFTEPGTTNKYYVEYRSGTGTDAGAVYTDPRVENTWTYEGAPLSFRSGVRIYRLDAKGNAIALSRNADGRVRTTLTQGETYTAPNGKFKVEVPSVTTTAAQVKITVGTPPTTTTPTVTLTAGSSAYGLPGKVTVKVTAPNGTPTGTVEIYNGNTRLTTAPLTAGTATANLPATLPAGAHTLTARYLGAGGYTPANGAATFTVTKANSTLNASAATGALGRANPVTVTVRTSTGVTPTGNVRIYNGNTQLITAALNASGAATLTTPASLTAGTHALTVRYDGTTNIAGSSAVVALVIKKDTPTLTFAVTAAPYGKTSVAKVTVKLNNAPRTGTVDIFNGSTKIASGTLSAGVATVNLPKMTAGSHTLTAKYAATASTSEAAATTVVKISKAPTTVKVTSAGGTWGKGGNVTVTVSTATDTTSAKVSLYEGPIKLSEATVTNGKATLPLPTTLTVGQHALEVRYAGTANTAAATTRLVTSVTKVASTVTATPGLINYAQAGLMKVTVKSTSGSAVTGLVGVYNGTTKLVEAPLLTGGTVNLTLPARLNAGTYNLTVKYLGSSTTAPSTTTAKTVINPGSPVATISTAGAMTRGSALNVTVKLDRWVTQMPTGTVRIKVGATYVTAAAPLTSNGTHAIATLRISALPAGTVSVEYKASGNFASKTWNVGTVK